MVAEAVKRAVVLLIACCAFGVLAVPAADEAAEASGGPKEYRPPTGFNGHLWDEPLREVKGLTLWHAYTALNSLGKMTDVTIGCKPDLPCTINQEVDGDGSFALGEYYFNQDQNPWAAQRVQLFVISYLFCAAWQGDYLPRDMKKNLKLCGVRLMFRSDTKAQLAKREIHYESNFDRILKQLIVEHGEPPGYERTPTITIESADERVTTPEKAKPEYTRYRWCGTEEEARRLQPSCSATVTLVYEAGSGAGTILYATAPLYKYAFARHNTGEPNNELYVLLNGRSLDKPNHYEKRECTGTLICAPRTGSMSSKDSSAFQP